MKDRQTAAPVGWCCWCGQEIYPDEEAWQAEGHRLHEDCVAPYAKALWPHETMTSGERNGCNDRS